MTEFKPGDRVFYDNRTGVIEAINRSLGDHRVRFDDSGAIGYYFKNELAPIAEWEWELFGADKPNTRPLVGPAPKVEAPVFVAPFRAGGGEVFSDNGKRVLLVDRSQVDASVVAELAVYVVAALNARVFGEE